ncbi:hypothetical protein [Methanosarcina barkeri]|uniref:hypothetical protein n=1 Tax=Methanosarcina barkeri TaxID=2208 RepID=UPI000AA79FB9|nr:hypothetical protein [Methanosarcina barkeri]
MSGVRWRVSLLFALITLSIFLSLLANSDRFMEVRGNGTYTQTGTGSLSNSIVNLTNRLEAGNHEARLNAAAELGKLGSLRQIILLTKLSQIIRVRKK